MSQEQSSDTIVMPVAEPAEPATVPPYNLIIHDDDLITFEFVIALLMKVVKCSQERAKQFAITVDKEKRAIVWTGPLEWAEVKQEQIHSYPFVHPVLTAGRERKLRCTIEPAA